MSDQAKLIVYGITAVVVIVVALVVYSYDTLEPREIGILYNTIDKTIDSTPYTGGAHFVGLFNSFIHFPGGYESIEFSTSHSAGNNPLSARTSDGVSLGLSLSFQYKLIRAELPKLYEQSNVNYESTFINIARDTLLQTAAEYQAKQFWNSRQDITEDMQKSLNQSLSEAHAECVGLQMLSVSIPDNLESKIVDTQVEKQLSSTKVYEREAELIRKDIDILYSQCEQNITTITAGAEAEAYFVMQVAEAASKRRTIDVQAEIAQFTIGKIGFNQTEFTEYLYLRAIDGNDDATITVGLDNAVIQIKTS
jgi:hypothetical protein